MVTPVALRAPSVTTPGESVHDVLAPKLVNDVLALESHQLPVSSHIVLKVVSLFGQEVCRLVNAWAPAGYHHLHWQGQDGDGRKVSTGIYLLVMQAGDYVGQRKLMVLQ